MIAPSCRHCLLTSRLASIDLDATNVYENQACKALSTHMEALFLFAFVWSVGCTVDELGRKQFDAWMRCETASNTSPWLFPNAGTVSTFFRITGSNETTCVKRVSLIPRPFSPFILDHCHHYTPFSFTPLLGNRDVRRKPFLGQTSRDSPRAVENFLPAPPTLDQCDILYILKRGRW